MKFDYIVVDSNGNPVGTFKVMKRAKEDLEKWNKKHPNSKGRIVVIERK